MARKLRTALIAVAASMLFLNSVYNHLFHGPPSAATGDLLAPPLPLYLQTNPNLALSVHKQQLLQEDQEADRKSSRHVTALKEPTPTVSILIPAWEVLVILPPETLPPASASCLFPNNIISTATPYGFLSAPFRPAFKCDLPARLRRRAPFPQPVLFSPEENTPPPPSAVIQKTPAPPELLRWNFLVYESITTENDVVLFVKGLIHRQSSSRSPTDFACVFGDDVSTGIRTAVTSSVQEVFRCQIPKLTPGIPPARTKISLEISQQNRLVPSVAYYTPPRKIATERPKSLLCACTMVYNVAKFLKEWVIYHSAIGVQRFILYDNGSDDDLERVVEDLTQSGYDVTTTYWIWAKTQEAGFSHCALRAKDTCKWVAFVDVDEFIYSPSWVNSSSPSQTTLRGLLPKMESSSIGQVLIGCHEFGPSHRESNPEEGVIQGYNCRRKDENRHKSIVLLDALDESLLNVIHHFRLKQGYKGKKLRTEAVVVNHYKYQAWAEFKTKFRRRVSAYVADWTEEVNPTSKDRTPGLGYVPVEPKGWAGKFCEVYDDRLRELTRRWFGFGLSSEQHNGLQES